jgi:prepilin-type N-terminal cleavage/methylation domain-containing protein
MGKVIALVSGRQKRGSQLGFTLVELMIAIAISGFIVVGSLVLLGHMIIVTAENRDETMAVLQVQYVGFWVSEDVVQAQSVELGAYNGFPLRVEWTEWDGDVNEVIYSFSPEGEVWTLMREHRVNGESYGTIVVSEHLVDGPTRCFWHETSDDVLIVEVTARVDRNEASSRYEIHPRALE